MILQEKLYALRSRAGLTQEALAEAVGVSRQAVAKWEQGTSMPDIGNIVALARAFQVTVDSLVKPEMDCGMRAHARAGEGGRGRAHWVPHAREEGDIRGPWRGRGNAMPPQVA